MLWGGTHFFFLFIWKMPRIFRSWPLFITADVEICWKSIYDGMTKNVWDVGCSWMCRFQFISCITQLSHCFTPGSRFLVMQPFGNVVPSILWSFRVVPPLCLLSKAEEPHEETWEVLNYFCHSLHIIHIFSSIIQTQRDSKGKNLPYRVEFWKHMLHFITKSQGNVLITGINKCSSSLASLCFSKGLSSW